MHIKVSSELVFLPWSLNAMMTIFPFKRTEMGSNEAASKCCGLFCPLAKQNGSWKTLGGGEGIVCLL